MGDKDKNQDKSTALDLINESIMAIERRQGYLKAKLNFETDDKAKQDINDELNMLDQEHSFTVDAKRNIEQEIKKANEEEKRKYIENLLKAGYFIGKMRENIRLNMEHDKRMDKEIEAFQSMQFDRAVEKIFGTLELNNVTADMIDDIVMDEEFIEMEKTGDVNRMERKEADMKASVEAVFNKILGRDTKEDLNADFETKKNHFTKKMSEDKNYLNAAEKIRKMMNSKFFKNVATKEDKEFYSQLYQDIHEVGLETDRLYADMLSGETSFEKGNGFTRELIDKEKDIKERLDKYNNDVLLPRMQELIVKEDKNVDDVAKMYSASLEFVDPIVKQNTADLGSFESNEFRTRMEMWQVYERLPKGTALTKKQLKRAMDDEFKAWDKIERMKRTGKMKGGIEKNISEWSSESAFKALSIVKDQRDLERDNNIAKNQKKQLDASKKQEVKKCIASLVLKAIIDIEMNRKEGQDKSHYKELVNFKKTNPGDSYDKALKNHFDEMTEKLMREPDFVKQYDKLTKGKDFTSKVMKLIGEDIEKEIAKDIAKKAPELQNDPPKKELKKELKKEDAPVLRPTIYN
ncbi:hypothetical protein SAMN02910369_00730 [Lachnospiraceae bacterium NE2001]|nr:hypothetical protein SAMN02910369_00730 [Lachnospiraceae bacterium NE2001]